MLHSRAREILKKIIDSPYPIRIKDLTFEFQVSSRTVKYDLETLRLWLRDKQVELISQPNRGIWVSGEEDAKQNILEKLGNIISNELYPTQDDRLRHLTLDLLLCDEYQTIQIIAEKIGVSRNTVISDLQKIEQSLGNWNMQLERKMHHGFRVLGSEMQRRLNLEYIIQNCFTSHEMFQIIQGLLQTQEIPLQVHPVIEKYLISRIECSQVYSTLKSIVLTIQRDLGIIPSERTIFGILLRICISIKRSRQNHQLDSIQCLHEILYHNRIHEALMKLSEKLEIIFTENEETYITLPLVGSYQNPMVQSQLDREELLDFISITRKLIQRVSEKMNLRLEEDSELFDNLLAHLTQTLTKYKYKVLNPNPMTSEIIRSYSDMFLHVKNACTEILDEYHVFLTDSDIAFLVIHFQVAYERHREDSTFKALVVCGTGRGTARLLKTLIENQTRNLEIVGYCSIMEVEKALQEKNIDIVISVLPIELQVPVVLVHPIPTQQNIAMILKTLEKIRETSPVNKAPVIVRNTDNDFLEMIDILKSNLHQSTIPFAEDISREIIMKGFELSQHVLSQLKDHINEQNAVGLTLHLFLMVQRIAFQRPYENLNSGSLLDANRKRELREQVVQILKDQNLHVTEAEIDAILRYLV